MLLDNYLRNLPWVLPVFLVGLGILVLAAPRVQQRTGLSRRLFVAFGLAAVGFAALVATPSHGTLKAKDAGTFDAEIRVPAPRDLYAFTELGLNIWMTVPLGFLALLVTRRLRRGWPLLVAFAVPLSCELLQWAFPQMNRVGFQLSDLLANWVGVVVGLGVAALFAVAHDRSRAGESAAA
ncbi:VanZ family protein [Nocardioides sp. Bht2]|uniref:VanZ family protein n=1 Tax=Nocardioides sp. Bht2 TaxID=3392297 RepID=UPI0039B64F6C